MDSVLLLSHLGTLDKSLIVVLLYLNHFCLIDCLRPLLAKHEKSTFVATSGDRTRSYKITSPNIYSTVNTDKNGLDLSLL